MAKNNQNEIEEKARQLLNDLLSNTDLNKVVTLDKARGIVYIGGQKVTPERLMNLKSEAQFLVESELWHLIYETPKELAQRAMFVNSESLDDMKKGKSILYTLSTQKNIVDTFLSYVPK